MVVILVAALFVTVALVTIWQKRRAEALALASAIDAPIQDIRFHTGHAWAGPVGQGYYKVGVNDLAASLAGTPDRLHLPRQGSALYQNVHQIEIGHGSRRLEVQSPLSGKVLRVNRVALRDPAQVARDPYRTGWLAIVRPRELREFSTLLDGDFARRWLDALRRKVAEFTAQASPVTAWDGGPLQPGFGDDLTDSQFEELKSELFANTK